MNVEEGMSRCFHCVPEEGFAWIKSCRGLKEVAYGVGYFAGYILLGIIALTMIEVLTRYVLRQPLILCDEFGGYSLFAITFPRAGLLRQREGPYPHHLPRRKNVDQSIRPDPSRHPLSRFALHRDCQQDQLGFSIPLFPTGHEVEFLAHDPSVLAANGSPHRLYPFLFGAPRPIGENDTGRLRWGARWKRPRGEEF